MRSKAVLEAICSKADAELKVFQEDSAHSPLLKDIKPVEPELEVELPLHLEIITWLPNVAPSGCTWTCNTQTPTPSLIPFPCQKVEISGIKSQIKFRDIKELCLL